MASSAAPERVSGPRWRNTNRSRSAGGRVNAVPHVIRSLPVQPASSAVSAGSRTVRRPDSQARLSSKLSRTTRSVSAGWAARLAAEASPLTTVTIRSGASRLTRAAIWAPQVVTILALPRLARGRDASLRVGLALVGTAGAGLVAATAAAGGLAVRAIGGAGYAAELGRLAPCFVLVGALYAVTVFLLNAQLAAGARWPSVGVWAVVAGLPVVVAVVRPAGLAQMAACAAGAAAVSVLTTGAAVWWRRSASTTTAPSLN